MEHHHHAQTYSGYFSSMGKEGMREFFDKVKERLNRQYQEGETHEDPDFPR
jgi:hypothetical protein